MSDTNEPTPDSQGSTIETGENSDAGVDRVVTSSSQSWFGRLRDSLIGSLLGILMVVASVILLYWNEKTELVTMRALDFGAHGIVEATAERIDPGQDGRLVHLSGTLATRSPASDPVFGSVADGAIRLARHVEMFQWQEHSSSSTQKSLGGSSTTQTTHEYSRVWSETPIDSGSFQSRAGHMNPAMSLRSATTNATDVSIGPRKPDAAVLDRLTGFTPVAVTDRMALPTGWQRQDDGLYRGRDPMRASVGDVRVRFTAVSGGTVSVIAGQQGDRLSAFATPSGAHIAMASTGVANAEAMFNTERSEARTLAWLLRLGGFVLALIGLVLVARPLAVLASVLPFLEGVVDVAAFVVMFGVATLLTFGTIAIARIVLQPLMSLALLAGGIGTAALCLRLHRRRPAPKAQSVN